MIDTNTDTNGRAVSPVVGVALLIAIAVILAAVIGAVVLGLGTGGADTPQAQLQIDFDGDNGDALLLVHNGGEPLEADRIVVSIDGDADYELEDDLTAGQSVQIVPVDDSESDPTAADNNGDEDDITIIWEDPNSDTEYVLEQFEAALDLNNG